MRQIKYSIQRLFVDLGFKKTYNKPTLNTACGQYASLMYKHISDPNVSVYDAQMWIAQHKSEINKLIK